MKATLAVSWGPSGGFYLHRYRICLWRLAITYVPVEIDDLLDAYAAREVRYVPDEPDGTDGPIEQPRLRWENDALLIPGWWTYEHACWELFRAQNRCEAHMKEAERLRRIVAGREENGSDG